MSRFVITIGREFGCNASSVGRKIAAKLNIKFYEKELVEKAAKVAGMDESSIYNIDGKESKKALMQHYVNEFDYGTTSGFYNENAVEAQASVIRDLAQHESCVMFGRCADYFLSDFDNVLNVFLYAPADYRTEHVSNFYNLSVKESKKLIKKIDKLRRKWYKYATGQDREEINNRHLMINMEKFTVDEAVDIIIKTAQMKLK